LNALIGSIGGSAGGAPLAPLRCDEEAGRLYARWTGCCRVLPEAFGGGSALPGLRNCGLCTRCELVSGPAARGCPGVTAGGLAAGVRALSLNDGYDIAAGNRRPGGFGAGADVVGRLVGGVVCRGRTGPLPSPPGGVVREFTVSPHAPTPTCTTCRPVRQAPTVADARSLLAYVPPKSPRGEAPPTGTFRSEYGESGD
jgi:hypothetical protein